MRRSYIYNKVKALALVTLLAPCASFFLAGCGDFLEIEPQDKVVLEKFWKEKADVDNVLLGCYSAMQSANVLDRIMVWGEFRSDNIEAGTNLSDDYSLKKVVNEAIEEDNAYTTWDGIYDVINRCNIVLHYAPEVAAKDPAYTDAMLKNTQFEAKALRALCYFYLIRTFKNVPYTTEATIDDNQKFDLPATPFNEVLDKLIADLEGIKDLSNGAIKAYPSTQALYKTGRMTQQAVYAMLCEMYLWKQDYQKCIDYGQLVVDAKKEEQTNKYPGRVLDADGRLGGYPLELSRPTGYQYFGYNYQKIFGMTNADASDATSDENIFELVFWQSESMLQNNSVDRLYASGTKYNSVRGLVAPAKSLVYDKNVSTNVFKQTDGRYYQSIREVTGAGTSTYRIGKYVLTSMLLNVTGTDVSPYLYSSQINGHNHANWIVYRLSDVMLLMAEAYAEQNNLTKSFELVKAVNNRSMCEATVASLTQPLTQDAMRKLVLEERRRELLFEGKRWYDLVRRSMRDGNTDVLCEYFSKKTLEGSSAAAKQRLKKLDAIFWPYNHDETVVNTNLVQNPAYKPLQ